MHPAKVQLRGFDGEEILEILKSVEKVEVVWSRDGIDLFFRECRRCKDFCLEIEKEIQSCIKNEHGKSWIQIEGEIPLCLLG
ncbi:MAG: hypothetical protein QXM15_03435 [Archaeoglobaceae archaeon]